MVSRTAALIGAVVVVAIVGAAIFLIGGGPSSTEGPTTRSLTVKLTEVEGEKKRWVPDKVYLKKGDTVKLTIINGDDDDEHRFAIPDLGVESEDIPPANGQVTLTFTADRAGIFKFIDPLAPDWDSPECEEEEEEEREEPICIPLGEIIVEG